MFIEILSNILADIWWEGDRDEISIKHISHTFACLLSGRNWNEQIDYMSLNENEIVKKHWTELQNLRDTIGITNFREMLLKTQFSDWVDYMADDYPPIKI